MHAHQEAFWTDMVFIILLLIVVAAIATSVMDVEAPQESASHDPLAITYCTSVRDMLRSGLQFEAMGIATNEQVQMVAADSNPESALAYVYTVCLEYYDSRLNAIVGEQL